MIINAVLNIVYIFLQIILSPLSLFGDVSINSNILESIKSAQTWYSSLNVFIPVDIILVILGLLFIIEGIIATYKLIMWLKRLIPTMGG